MGGGIYILNSNVYLHLFMHIFCNAYFLDKVNICALNIPLVKLAVICTFITET